MTKSETIDLTLCFISIVWLLVNCYLFYRNLKNHTDKKNYSLLICAFFNMGISYGVIGFIFYMFSFIVLSKETIEYLHETYLICYIIEGLFFLIACVIEIVSKRRIKDKSPKRKCSKCIHKKVCYITDHDKNDIKSCKNFIDKSSLEEVSND